MDIDPCYYHITSDSNLLRVRMEHMWDLATTVSFCQELGQHIHNNLDGNWAVIADLRHWCLESGEACDTFYQYHKQCIEFGMRYQAIILPKSSLKRWRIKSFVADDYMLSTLLAEDEPHAIAWLLRKGFIAGEGTSSSTQINKFPTV